jgi:hypothetical protein
MKIFLIGVMSALLYMQGKPDLSGSWILAGSDAPAAAGASAKPVVVVLTQTDSTLTLQNGDQTIVFPLDGSETVTKTGGPGAPRELRIRSRWEGAKLVVEQLTDITSMTTTVSLDDDRKELTVETVAKTGQGSGREKQVFKRSQ